MTEGLHALDSFATPARSYAKGIGDAVADRTINRLQEDGTRETWADVARRVAQGNAMLHPRPDPRYYDPGQDWLMSGQGAEFHRMHHHLRQASLLMSGRHLQHGDASQVGRPQEVFTNCSTSAASFLTFYLLLNGSGVGRCYDDGLMLVDWSKMPTVVPVIDGAHADVRSGEIRFFDRRTAEHLYADREREVFMVPDSREGWAKAVEKMELMTYLGDYEKVLILDFSEVRPKGSPIMGMQGRPASGPCPLMVAIANVSRLRDSGMKPWRSAMYADHYLAECVLVGGARRAARMSTKTWRDRSVLDFIRVKRGGFLWSSNNSVIVDEEFWKLVRTPQAEIARTENFETVQLGRWAKQVFEAVMESSFKDGTGEPGLINGDKLAKNSYGIGALEDGRFAESSRYKLEDESLVLTKALVQAWIKIGCPMIVNPCGEITLIALGAYCVIADVVPYHAGEKFGANKWRYTTAWDDDAEDAFRTAARALIRTNLMDCLYRKEVTRTNRIGVGMTGFHEWAWARFGFGWKDLIDEEKSKELWLTLSRFKRAVVEEATNYSNQLGVAVPHTNTTMKPAGTTSKLFGLTEGAHLPAMREYLRWVQFRNDDPLIEQYRAKGYPVRELRVYEGTTIVGFPTAPTICTLGMGEALVTAGEATPAEQFRYLQLLEKYWIRGVAEDGVTPLAETGNQVSYTLKIDPKKVSFEDYCKTVLELMPTVRCCSIMLQEDAAVYEYVPEQAVTKADFELMIGAIKEAEREEVGLEHVTCAGGACPVDFRSAA